MKKEALLYKPAGGGAVICGLCAHRCRIEHGKSGICRVRINEGGALYAAAYGRLIAEQVDPIEKKPLSRFLPSSMTYSIASAGCNFKCGFCQNWGISQASGLRAGDVERLGSVSSPQRIVEYAISRGCQSVSYTYTEPTVFFEFALATAKLARDAGLKNVFVSNGYMTNDCLKTIGPYLDACNIDLKSFSDDFYKNLCGASLDPVLDSLKTIKNMGIWLEVTTLVIPGKNDSDAELGGIAEFIAANLSADTPWHVSRFFPNYKMTAAAPTEPASVKRALEIGKNAGLKYVYPGNVVIV